MQSTSKNVFNLNNEEDIQLIHDYLVASDSESDNYDENIDSDESDDLEARVLLALKASKMMNLMMKMIIAKAVIQILQHIECRKVK